LQSRFAIVRGPGCAWHTETLKNILYACIILHNIIVEDERHTYANFDSSYDQSASNSSTTEIFNGPPLNFENWLHKRVKVRDRQIHH